MGVIQITEPTEASKTTDGTTTITNDAPADNQDVKDKLETPDKKVEVVMDGPLSQVYTQALNIAYANEGTDDMIVGVSNKSDSDADSGYVNGSGTDVDRPIESEDVYAYVTDARTVEDEGNHDAIRAICKQGNTDGCKKILVIECHGKIGTQVGLLDNMASSLGIETHYSRKTGLEAIKRAAGKK